MKNRILYTLFLLLIYTGVSAAEIGGATRREIGRTLTRIVGREISGGWVKISGVKASRGRVQLYASIGLSYYPFRVDNVQAMYDSVRAVLPQEFHKARLEIYTDKHLIEELIPLAYRTTESRKKKDRERFRRFVNPSERPLVTRLDAPAPEKGLAGRHIALWQSHGRYFDQPENQWKWQRSRLWETCEDLYTQSYVLPYLVPMLENAGACVMLPRERDVQKFEVLADNDVPGQYAEENGAQSWCDGGAGFAHVQQVYRTGENPFRHGTARRVKSVTAEAESRAVWRAAIPEQGEYAVYVSYESTPQNVDDAHYTVHHLGGESKFAVNQTMGGGTWIYLGRFLFPEGGNETVVTLSNRSRLAGKIVSADAVKIGGGYGNIARTVCDSLRVPGLEYTMETSGYPRFCEGARYWLQWAGFGEEVYSPKQDKDDYKDDYMSRALWVNALMGGSERLRDSAGLHIPIDMALAFHSDSGVRDGDEIIGTLGIFFTKDKNGKFEGGADRYRSRDLTDIVMTQIVSDIRRTFEPAWNRRGLWNRSYFEARVPNVPTMLLELLSHQNFFDMRYGSDPRFKFLVSRAVYKGILKHLAAQYEVPYVVQPLPVEAFATQFTDDGNIRLCWTPVVDSLEDTAAPSGYLVYTRRGDGGFDNGRYTERPYLLTEQEPGEIYSYRVTAVNDGGESFPSETLAVCRMPDASGNILIVNGFDRVSGPLSMRRDSTAGFYNDIDAGVPYMQDISFIGAQRIFDLSQARCEDDQKALGSCFSDYETEVIGGNTFDYPYLHGGAVVQAGYSFCSSSAKAVACGEMSLDTYDAVDLILGKQRSTSVGRGMNGYEFKTFPSAMQHVIGSYLASGGALFVSGSYVATDLWTGENATQEDRDFARETLHYDYGGGQSARRGRVRVVTSHAGFSRDEYRYHNEYGPDHYIVEAPDALKPAGDDAFAVMRYVENNETAGVAYAGPGRTFVMGFPFEAIPSEVQRNRLMRDVLEFLTAGKNNF